MELIMVRVNGIIVPCITFFNKDFKIINELNSLLIRHILLNGADALFIFGNTGEGITFYDKEREKRRFLEIALKQDNNKIPILLGVFGNQSELVINQIASFGRTYESISFVIAPPFLHKLPEVELKDYFESILGSIDTKIQIFLYNNPSRFAGNRIEPNILKKLLNFTNLKGIKDTVDDLKNTQAYLEFLNENFSIFCGEENNYSAFLKLIPLHLRRYSGLVPSISNISNICKKMFQNALNGKDSELDKLQKELNRQQKAIYDIKVPKGQEPRGLKHTFYNIYKDELTITENDATLVSHDLQRNLEQEVKNKIQNMVDDLIKSKLILKSV
jgi:4-hydroxy-tetrahydrodipicolinate synthase